MENSPFFQGKFDPERGIRDRKESGEGGQQRIIDSYLFRTFNCIRPVFPLHCSEVFSGSILPIHLLREGETISVLSGS